MQWQISLYMHRYKTVSQRVLKVPRQDRDPRSYVFPRLHVTTGLNQSLLSQELVRDFLGSVVMISLKNLQNLRVSEERLLQQHNKQVRLAANI